MLTPTEAKSKLEQVFEPSQADVLTEVWVEAYGELVKVGDFAELKGLVKELAQAQGRTEARMGGLEAAMEKLAEAQARTEAAQARTAEAQTRTEVALGRLSRQVGGLSETVGGDLEDVAYIVLHEVLKRELGWEVEPLERAWQKWGEELEEIDVFGRARDPSRPEQVIWIVGEAKHNLTRKEVKRFAGRVERARAHLEGEVFPVCFCYRARPEVQEEVRTAALVGAAEYCIDTMWEPAFKAFRYTPPVPGPMSSWEPTCGFSRALPSPSDTPDAGASSRC